MKWSEDWIASAITTQVFQGKHLVVVPRCNWTGNECDLLAVTRDLRVIDIEIKISRADLKADAAKFKWVDRRTPGQPRAWPQKVWKHYYVMPAEVWRPELAASLPSPNSGVITLRLKGRKLEAAIVRPAKPNTKADRISAEQVLDIARLVQLRYWSTRVKVTPLFTPTPRTKVIV
jgi:hypothetical protein